MNSIRKGVVVVLCVLSFLFFTTFQASAADAAKSEKAKKEAQVKLPPAKAAFDVNKMADMSDYDPNKWVNPKGDTIKIAVVQTFSGPAAINGELMWLAVTWAAYDINKRGGIFVDGKKKLIEIIKADHMSKPDQCKKICERMVLQEKVHILLGTSGSNMMKIINEVGNKYKVITQNIAALSDDLQDANNFSRYSFMTSATTDQIGRGLAYYYGQIRKKEKKFYILCQDYSFGRTIADGFKQGLKEYYPEGQIVGEDYHKLFLTDFAPYLTKIKASGAEVIFTGDWPPDSANLLKQARQMGMKHPFANVFMSEVSFLQEVGVEGTKGLVNIEQYGAESPYFKTPEQKKYHEIWTNQWKKWKAPYTSHHYEHGVANIGSWTMQTYWLLSVIERTQSLDPEKIISTWENDSYRFVTGKVMRMRACDHTTIQDLAVSEYAVPEEQKISMNVPPYYWFKGNSYIGPSYRIPADKILPKMDQKLSRCKGKNAWGE